MNKIDFNFYNAFDAMLCVTSLDGDFCEVNSAFLTLLCYTKEELFQYNFFDLIIEEDRQKTIDLSNLQLKKGLQIIDFEHRLLCKGGEIRWVRWKVRPDVQNNLAYGFAIDITEEKLIQDTLYFVAQKGWEGSQQNFLMALVEYLAKTTNLEYALVDQVVDDKHEVVKTIALYANYDFAPNMSYELVGTPCQNVFGNKICVYPTNVQTLFPADVLLEHMNAESYIGIPLWDSKGNPMGLIALLGKRPLYNSVIIESILQIVAIRAAHELEKMITENQLIEYNLHLEKQVKERTIDLEKAKEQAEYANLSKTQFLANMSHEIRTPINAILGFSEILSKKVIDEKQKSYLTYIQSSGKSLLTLINDILDLSKIEVGKLSIENSAVNIIKLVKEIMPIFHQSITEKGIDFFIEIEPNLPQKIFLDEVRLRQILFNLIGNAIKFTDKGYIKLKVYTKQEQGIDLCFLVEDTGIGIPSEQIQHIFKIFEQRVGQSHAKYGGTGLGLSISKKLAELMNGELTVVSEEGVGSQFLLYLKNILIDEHIDEYFIETELIESVHFKNATILIVDDVETNRMLIKEFLVDYTMFQLLEAANGQEALTLCENHSIDLILLDLKMPVLDGFQTIEILKNQENTKKIPVVGVSTVLNKTNLMLFDAFLPKPISYSELLKTLMLFISYEYSPNKMSTQYIISAIQQENIFEMINDLKMKIPEWERVKKGMLLKDISQFADEIHKIAQSYQSNYLMEWVKLLQQELSTFNIQEIVKVWNEFPKMIEQLK